MRRGLSPELVRLILWVGTLLYCAAVGCWLRIDRLRHPDGEFS
jgi:hypothetical protein